MLVVSSASLRFRGWQRSLRQILKGAKIIIINGDVAMLSMELEAQR
jgi:hypothetical protein